jgi:hypothetical protein
VAVVQFKKPVNVDDKSSGFAMNGRDILQTDWYKNNNARLIYLDLSLRVTHSVYTTTFNKNKITLQPNQYATKLGNLAKVINGTTEQARNALKILEKHGVISKFTLGTQRNKCSIITLNSNTLNNTLNTHCEPVQKGCTEVVQHTTHTLNNTVKQEEYKTIKETYVKNDNKNASALLVRNIVKSYNESFPELPSVSKITPGRKSKLIKIINDKFTVNGNPVEFKTLHDWEGLFSYMQNSDFLMGRSSDWQMTFDFMINSTNFVKIIEGNYDNK